MITVMRKFGPLAAVVLASSVMLVGCVPGQESSPSPTPSEPAQSAPEAPAEEPSCDWDSPKLVTDTLKIPQGQEGDLATVIIGSWQETHYKSGDTFYPVKEGTDIRDVFTSAGMTLTCESIEGFTHQKEGRIHSFNVEGSKVRYFGYPNTYTMLAWDANSIVWKIDGKDTVTLLQRRPLRP